MLDAENPRYLIENKVIFIPEKQSLVHTDSLEQIKLKPTASLCLLLLLRKHSEIVTQNELLAFAWGESHRQVSFNAFYQSILSLRKSFLHMNVEKQIITTLPRKGLVIQGDISVEKIESPAVVEASAEFVISDTPPEAVIASQEKPKRAWLNLTEVIIILLTIFISGLQLYPRVFNDTYFSRYIPAKMNAGQCHYFINADASTHIRHEEFIKRHPEMCENNKFLYITAYPETKNISVILCSTSIEQSHDNSCQSVYYPRYDRQ